MDFGSVASYLLVTAIPPVMDDAWLDLHAEGESAASFLVSTIPATPSKNDYSLMSRARGFNLQLAM